MRIELGKDLGFRAALQKMDGDSSDPKSVYIFMCVSLVRKLF